MPLPPVPSEATWPLLLLVDPEPARHQALQAAARHGELPWRIHRAATLAQAHESLATGLSAQAIVARQTLPDGPASALLDPARQCPLMLAFTCDEQGLMAQALAQGVSDLVPLGPDGHFPPSLAVLLQAMCQRHREMARIAHAALLLERVSAMASVGGWTYDPGSEQVLWSQETRRIHDVGPDFVPTAINVAQFYVPESREKIQTEIARYSQSGKPWSMEIEIITASGRRVWTRVRGQTQFSGGTATAIWGTIQDISEQKATEIKLLEATHLLSQSAQDLRVTMDSISQGIMRVDAQGHINVANRRFMELLDLPESLVASLPTMADVIRFQTERGDFGDDYEWVEERARNSVKRLAPNSDPDTYMGMYLRTTRAGATLEVNSHVLPSGGLVRTYTDVTAHHEAQRALKRSENRFRSLTELSSDWYWEQDEQLRFVSVDGSTLRVAGLVMPTNVGLTFWEVGALNLQDSEWEQLRAEQLQQRTFRDLELHMSDAGGLEFWITVSGTPVFDDAGHFTGYRGVGRNISERKRAQRKIEQLAFYDVLTGLPNRRMLIDRLKLALASSARRRQHGALLFIDLDNFKSLNDTLGHDVGDELLRQVAKRLGECVREIDTVARFGGDEFVVMLEELDEVAHQAAPQAETVGKKVITALNHPFDLAGQQHHTSPSIGLTLIGDQAHGVDELLKRADLAMYQAKAAGRNTLRFFDPDMQAAANARAALESDLRQSIGRKELLLHYQVVVDAQGRTTGVEALVRWQHPERGLVMPGQFIALAEQSGLILHIGQWVLEAACAQLVAWNNSAVTRSLTIAVNVSARQFRHPEFADQILALLRLSGANPYRLKLELTESLLVTDMQDAIEKMGALRAIGVSFALDDFGTGYSSLAYLKRLPLDQLKIDQSFVRDVLTDPNDAAIARTILTLAHSLDLAVVAEGVETLGQRNFLMHAGCKAFQGYLFGRPVPVDQLKWEAGGSTRGSAG